MSLFILCRQWKYGKNLYNDVEKNNNPQFKIYYLDYTISGTILCICAFCKETFPNLKAKRDLMATCFCVCPEVGCTLTGLKWKQEVDLHKQYHISQKDKLARIAALLAR